MIALVQTALCCPCGRPPAKRGLSATCYALHRRDQVYFGGLRERVLERDGRHCRGCGMPGRLSVHHRRPGLSILRYMVALCPACHQRVHRIFVMRRQVPGQLLILWRELHPDAPEQLGLDFDRPPAVIESLSLELLWCA